MTNNPGQLSHLIAIYLPVKADTDADGFTTDGEPVLIRKCYARVANTSGRELITGNAAADKIIKRFYIRHGKTKLTTSMYVMYQGDKYNVTYVSDIEDLHREDEIVCERVGDRNGNVRFQD